MFTIKIMKIFISHSSTDKVYAENLLKDIGNDIATFDKYSFEPGYSIDDMIKRSIMECDMFVLLISDKALESPWVQEEIDFASTQIVKRDLVFLPYCIDNKIKVKDIRLEPWIWKLLVKTYPLTKILARTLQRRIREFLWKKYPERQKADNLFVGRNKELGELEHDFLTSNISRLRALFITGFPYVGRRTMLVNFMLRYTKKDDPYYSPIHIRVQENDSTEALAMLLNSYVGKYSNDELLVEVSKGRDNSKTVVIELLLNLLDFHERVLIEDDACIVNNKGGVMPWFLDIVNDKRLPSEIIFYIASRFKPNSNFISVHESLLNYDLKTMAADKMQLVLKECLRIKDKKLSVEDTDDLCGCFTGYPKQAVDVVNDLTKGLSLIQVKANARKSKESYDGNYNVVLKAISEDACQLLIVMSKFDFISCDLLQEIYKGKDISTLLDELSALSLYSTFGVGNEYLYITPAIADYIIRMKMTLRDKERMRYESATKRVLSDMQDELTDLSSSLFAIKENIRNGVKGIKAQYLIPSFALKVMVEEYHNKNDANVVNIADRILADYVHVNYESCINAVHYWLCCSLARLQKKDSFKQRFIKEVEYFNKNDRLMDYYYLYGFFYRIDGKKSRLEKAVLYFDQSLDVANGVYVFCSTTIAKVQHEKVLVLILLQEYTKALGLAKLNYENNAHNSYHIRAYFNCLLHSANPDKAILGSLIDKINDIHENDSDVFAEVMKAQYEYYVESDLTQTINHFRSIFGSPLGRGKQYALDSFREICDLRSITPVFDEITKNVN